MAVLEPPKTRVIKAKVCLVGEFAVGKTSLAKRYVHNIFEDRYFATIGAKITKAEIEEVGRDSTQVVMTIWDIMGEKGFRELLKEAYFEGANAALGVCDLTRADTLEDLKGWTEAVRRIAGDVPMMIVGNKADLEEKLQLREREVVAFARSMGFGHAITSAKTGENVHAAFQTIAGKIAEIRA